MSMKIRSFSNKIMFISLADIVEVNAVISSLYTDNIQISKQKGLNFYH